MKAPSLRSGAIPASVLLLIAALGCNPPPGQYAGQQPGYYQPQPYAPRTMRIGGTDAIDMSYAGNNFAAGVAAAQRQQQINDAPARGYSSGSGVYFDVGAGHWIKKNIDRGQLITLEDGSLWEVSTLDRITASLWLTTTRITVADTNSMAYNLVNIDDGEVVEAKYLGVIR